MGTRDNQGSAQPEWAGKHSSCFTSLFSWHNLPRGWWKGCGCVCLHFCKAFDTVCHSTLLEKLAVVRMGWNGDENSLHWVKTGCVAGPRGWWMVLHPVGSQARLVPCRAQYLGQPCFISCSVTRMRGLRAVLSSLQTELGRSVHLLGVGMQRDLDMLDWNASCMRLSKVNCQVLHFSHNPTWFCEDCDVQCFFFTWYAGSYAMLIWSSLSMDAWDRLSGSLHCLIPAAPSVHNIKPAFALQLF